MDSQSAGQDVDMLVTDFQTSRHDCRWDFCRLSFLNRDLLLNHLLAEHFRRAVPVARRDILLDIRAEEGLGPSLQISDLMRDPSGSAPQTVLTQVVKDSEEHPSSSLPSPPASSPLTQPRHASEDDVVSLNSQSLQAQRHNPTFMSLVSPQGSDASLQIPASPTFSSRVRGPLKRKAIPELVGEPPKKHIRQEEIAQPSSSFNSSTSRNFVAHQLTQNVISDEEDYNYNPYSTSDSDTSGNTSSKKEHGSPIPGPSTPLRPASPTTPTLLTSTQNEADLYKTELHWPTSQASSSPIPAFSPPTTQSSHPLHIHESLSQPPSQLALPSLLQHGPQPKRSTPTLEPIQTGADVSIPFSQNSPIAVASPRFMASTPTRQNWYQPSAIIRRKSSKQVAGGSSGGSSPKASPPEQHAVMPLPQSPAPQPKSQPSQSSQKPPSKRRGFQSGNLASARASFSAKKPATAIPQAVVTIPLRQPQPLLVEPAPNSFVNEDFITALMQDTHQEVSQSQSSQSSDFSRSYPEIRTQAHLSQLD